MEQNPPLNQAIAGWLANYSHFVCDRLSLPHDQADELLREYLNITARHLSQQSVASSYEQPASHPGVPSPYHATHCQEQPPNLHPLPPPQTLSPIHSQGSDPYYGTCSREQPISPRHSAHLQTLPLDYLKAPNPYHETHDGEEPAQPSPFMVSTVPSTTQQGPFPLRDPPSSGIILLNANVAEDGTLPPQPTPPTNQTPIGSIMEYDPLWVQHSNEDPAAVERFSSSMKMDTLLTAGVIRIGDVLSFQVSVPGQGQPVETEAHLLVRLEFLDIGWSLH